MEVADRIRGSSAQLTSAERRVAEVILATPQTVGFGTVADLAAAAGAGAATVVRLATKLGFEGYTDLQSSVQRDLVHQLRPAAERIREQSGTGEVEQHAAVELSNIHATLDAIDPAALASLVERLADLSRPVAILTGDASSGVARHFADQVHLLRPGIALIRGNDVAVRRDLSAISADATLIVVDLRRYDRWILDALDSAREERLWTAAFTDSVLSPLAARADCTFVLSAGSIGPFDSHVGTLALLELVVNQLAAELRTSATDRLDGVERAWRAGRSLTDS